MQGSQNLRKTQHSLGFLSASSVPDQELKKPDEASSANGAYERNLQQNPAVSSQRAKKGITLQIRKLAYNNLYTPHTLEKPAASPHPCQYSSVRRLDLHPYRLSQVKVVSKKAKHIVNHEAPLSHQWRPQGEPGPSFSPTVTRYLSPYYLGWCQGKPSRDQDFQDLPAVVTLPSVSVKTTKGTRNLTPNQWHQGLPYPPPPRVSTEDIVNLHFHLYLSVSKKQLKQKVQIRFRVT